MNQWVSEGLGARVGSTAANYALGTIFAGETPGLESGGAEVCSQKRFAVFSSVRNTFGLWHHGRSLWLSDVSPGLPLACPLAADSPHLTLRPSDRFSFSPFRLSLCGSVMHGLMPPHPVQWQRSARS
jgi:hypothetical protein